MNVFLTGNIQVGKSTAIRRFLLKSGLIADGFMTYWELDSDKCRNLYLSPYSIDTLSVKRTFIASDCGNGLMAAENISSAFDVQGSAILYSSGRHDIIVMDELGFLETKSTLFQQAVLHCVFGDVPVLGVIKPVKTKFLDTIRDCQNVIVREVTLKSADTVLAWLTTLNWSW